MIPFKMVEVPKETWEKVSVGNFFNDVVKVFKSDRFLAQIRQHEGGFRIAINKTKFTMVDGKPRWADGITWDELQEIKNQCGFKDSWLCEYYPPAGKVVNIANIRHLWVMDNEPGNTLHG